MKNIIVVLVVYLVTFITSHGTSVNRLMRHKIKERRRQIQGENTNDLEPYQRHPYLLLIGYPLFFFNQSRSHFIPECVGVFITPQVVLTVADGCVRSDLTGFWIRYSVRSSISTSIRSNQSGHGIDVETLRAATNPRLDEERNAAEPFTDGRITSNIGLLVLQEPLTLDPMPVLHLPEPEEIDLLNSSQNLTVVGMTSPRGNDDRSDLVTAERVRNIEPCMLPRIPGVHAVCADNFTLIKCLGMNIVILVMIVFFHFFSSSIFSQVASERRCLLILHVVTLF